MGKINKVYTINGETFKEKKKYDLCNGCYFFENRDSVRCEEEPYNNALGDCGKVIFKKITNKK